MSNDRRQIVEALTEERAGLVCLIAMQWLFHLCSMVVRCAWCLVCLLVGFASRGRCDDPNSALNPSSIAHVSAALVLTSCVFAAQYRLMDANQQLEKKNHAQKVTLAYTQHSRRYHLSYRVAVCRVLC
jgi:hypothetical protein